MAKVVAKRKRASRKAKPKTKGLEAIDCRLDSSSDDIRDVVSRIEKDGGTVVGSWRDPLGGSPLVIGIVPIDSIEPTPFQRDLSEAHHKKLAAVIEKTGLFLDPVISVPAPDHGFWTPNGRHRLEAMSSKLLNDDTSRGWAYHNSTKHSEFSIRSTAHYLDWANQPLPLKIYTTIDPIPLPRDADQTGISALSAIADTGVPPEADRLPTLNDIARLLYFSAGITKKRTFTGGDIYFRAASCTGQV